MLRERDAVALRRARDGVLSILSQLLLARRGTPCPACSPGLSILSQLLRSDNSLQYSICSPLFQFFPSCFRLASGWRERGCLRLSILSQLLQEEGDVGDGVERGYDAFQFFPSCFSVEATTNTGSATFTLSILSQLLPMGNTLGRAYHIIRAFNSFPVASEGFVPGLAYKLFLLPSEVGKTASHPFATHERLLAFSTSGFANPGLKWESFPVFSVENKAPDGKLLDKIRSRSRRGRDSARPAGCFEGE